MSSSLTRASKLYLAGPDAKDELDHERWVQTCRRELPDRTLIWNRSHLLHALRESGQFYNGHRPHQGIANARSSHCPRRWQLLTKSLALTSDDVTDSAVCSTNTAMRHELHG
jgi:hypothetical protein